MDIKIFMYWGSRGAGIGRADGVIRSEKLKKSQEQYPFKNQILHNFNFKKNSNMDINFFLKGGAGGGVRDWLNFFFTYYYIISSM